MDTFGSFTVSDFVNVSTMVKTPRLESILQKTNSLYWFRLFQLRWLYKRLTEDYAIEEDNHLLSEIRLRIATLSSNVGKHQLLYVNHEIGIDVARELWNDYGFRGTVKICGYIDEETARSLIAGWQAFESSHIEVAPDLGTMEHGKFISARELREIEERKRKRTSMINEAVMVRPVAQELSRSGPQTPQNLDSNQGYEFKDHWSIYDS